MYSGNPSNKEMKCLLVLVLRFLNNFRCFYFFLMMFRKWNPFSSNLHCENEIINEIKNEMRNDDAILPTKQQVVDKEKL